MLSRRRADRRCKCLIAGAFLAAIGPLAGDLIAQEGGVSVQPLDPMAWEKSPYRQFGAAVPLLGERVLLFDEASDSAFTDALSLRLRALTEELHGRQAWRWPVSADAPLKVYVARHASGGVRELVRSGVDRDKLIGAALHLDASALDDEEAIAEVARLYALAVISAYRAPDRNGLAEAAASLLAGRPSPEEIEAVRIAASAPEIDVLRHRRSLGRLYVEEFVRAAGIGALRESFEQAAARGQDAHDAIAETLEVVTGETASALMVRFAARLYTVGEPEAGPSRMSMDDLIAGALDARPTAPFAIRHRTFVPQDSGALRVSWPDDAGPGAAVVRYRDAQLPADVVFFAPGESHAIALAGVSRVDWVVAGGSATADLPAPATVEPADGYPFAGLSVQAGAAGGEGTRLTWSTASHRGLAGWAVFREEVAADGRILRSGPEILPATSESQESYGSAWVDLAGKNAFRRYTVWAVTEEGLFARAFAVTLRAGE
ncbi:MAG TPA: hypothetical protein VIE39_04845 [Thermoanaerobaculia bacterium]